MSAAMQYPEQLRIVIEAAPIAIVVADADGRIASLNEQAARLFGYEREDLLGESVERLVPRQLRGAHADLRAAYLTSPGTRAMGAGRDLFGLRKNGTEVPIEIGLNPISTPEGNFTLAVIADITERRSAEEHLRLIVEGAPNANIVVDHTGKITLVNAQTERLFGYDRGDLLGAPVDKLVPELFRVGHGALRAGYNASPSPRPMGAGRDLYGLRKDGTEVPVEIGLSPIRTPKGEFVLASVVDITERKNAGELRGQRDRALDASHLKSQFVATMSHELRTPLNAIIATAELLSTSALDERQRAFVETIDESAEALLSIISSILDFSKIEAGKLDLEARSFDLESLVEGAATVLARQVRQKDLALHVYVDPSIPTVVRGDAHRLRQILLNLIANAVKFTADGRIIVRAIPVETSSRRATVRFEVEDTGVGIDPEVVPKLFEPFVQADSSSSRQFGGTGLGLSICKRLVELMQGEIGVDSKPGHGSLFWFTATFGRPSAVVASRRIFGVHALILSGDELFQEITTRYVEAWGIATQRARTAQEALLLTQSLGFEQHADWIAIVDADTVDLDAAGGMLASGGFGRRSVIPIGSDQRLAKPLRHSQLFDRIVEALGEEVAPSPPSAEPVAHRADTLMRTVLVAEDNESLREILVHQFAQLGVPVRLVANGKEAVGALQHEPFGVVFMDCHMPEMDGFAATRAIRAAEHGSGRHVPIIAMTASAFKEDREACLAAGMDDYLSKPVRINDLRGMVERWITERPHAEST
ncbi:MAG: PAS domain S-box protein [Candidatus Elarobacter sp.]